MTQRFFWPSLAASFALAALGPAAAAAPAATEGTARTAAIAADALLLAEVPAEGAVAGAGSAGSESAPESESSLAAEAGSATAARPANVSISELHAHEIDGRSAVTLYVRDIPVLTFLEPQEQDARSPQTQSQAAIARAARAANTPTQTVAATPQRTAQATPQANASQPEADPMARAEAVAERVNAFYRAGGDAGEISFAWDDAESRYWIEAADERWVAIDDDTVFPQVSPSLSDDARHATNRLRRQIGNAPPLEPEGPRRMRDGAEEAAPQATPDGRYAVASSTQGGASWYGPGFHGRRTASGEVFNQNAMTAAHRHLPFGTRVRVTNLSNGRSAIVRINDRGPFVRGRIIDLSVAAARQIDMYSSGVARVRVEVLVPTSTGPIAETR